MWCVVSASLHKVCFCCLSFCSECEAGTRPDGAADRPEQRLSTIILQKGSAGSSGRAERRCI